MRRSPLQYRSEEKFGTFLGVDSAGPVQLGFTYPAASPSVG